MEGEVTNLFSSLIEGFTTISTWFWDTLPVFFEVITDNPLILWSFFFAVASGVLLLFLKLIRKFGFKQKR